MYQMIHLPGNNYVARNKITAILPYGAQAVQQIILDNAGLRTIYDCCGKQPRCSVLVLSGGESDKQYIITSLLPQTITKRCEDSCQHPLRLLHKSPSSEQTNIDCHVQIKIKETVKT